LIGLRPPAGSVDRDEWQRRAEPAQAGLFDEVEALSSVEQPEMSKWAVIWLLILRPLFDFSQTIVGPFDFLQYLLCVRILFALGALLRKFPSFDVPT
jgi:hypothetical protein